ncbi:MAG: hypothetical protein IKK58_03880 [Clostridia bacterium]|nr:hypothetical protein [Clostridia bacterium]
MKNRVERISWASLGINVAFSAFYVIFAVVESSWWLFTLGIYYLGLSVVRFIVLRSRKREGVRVALFTGIMLTALVVPLAGSVILSVVRERGTTLGLIPMLTVAVYAFTKITLAVVNLVRSRHSTSERLIALKNISLADGLVSIFSLQRSMLVSFEGMSGEEIRIMNCATGIAVCAAVLLLGINLMSKRWMFTGLSKEK